MSASTPDLSGHAAAQDEAATIVASALESPSSPSSSDATPLLSLQPDLVVTLNVGGIRYDTSVATLRKYPDSLLGRMFCDENMRQGGLTKADAKGEYFIDRNGRFFECILDFYRTGQVYVPATIEALSIREEISFFQLPVDERQFMVVGERWADRLGKIAMTRALENAKPMLDKIMEHLTNALNAAAERGCWRMTLDICRTTAYVRTSGGVVKRVATGSSNHPSMSSSPPQVSPASLAANGEGLHPNQLSGSSPEIQEIPSCAPQWHSNLIDAPVSKWLANNDNRRLFESYLLKEGFKFTFKRELSFFVLSVHLFDLPRLLNTAAGSFLQSSVSTSFGTNNSPHSTSATDSAH